MMSMTDEGVIASRQIWNIDWQSSSGQSWRTDLSRYTAAPDATAGGLVRQDLLSSGYDVGLVEQDAGEARVLHQQFGEERSVPAAEVDNHTGFRKVVGGRDGVGHRGGQTGHRRVKHRSLGGVYPRGRSTHPSRAAP